MEVDTVDELNSVTLSCPTPCNPMDCSMTGFPVHHQLPELAQIHIESESPSHSVVSDSLPPMDCSIPGSSVHGISQARIPEWVAISSSRGSS